MSCAVHEPSILYRPSLSQTHSLSSQQGRERRCFSGRYSVRLDNGLLGPFKVKAENIVS